MVLLSFSRRKRPEIMAQLAARFLKQMVQARFSCNDISLHPCSPALQYDKEEVVIKSAFAPEILRAKQDRKSVV